MKSFDEDEESSDRSSMVPFMVYFKGFFLLSIIVAGVMILNDISKVNKTRSKALDQTMGTITNKSKALTSLQEKYVGKETTNLLQKVSHQVLGEATKLKNQTVSKSEEAVTDYVYENSIFVAFEGMINKLPERQKEKFFEKMCK